VGGLKPEVGTRLKKRRFRLGWEEEAFLEVGIRKIPYFHLRGFPRRALRNGVLNGV